MKRSVALILVFFGVIQANCEQFYSEVPFIGAMGEKNWASGWTNFKPVTQEYPIANNELSGVISTNTTLSKRSTYLIKGNVYLTNNATLYIEPGTIIRGDFETKGSLIITKGCKIRALGTEKEPIVFTSNQPAGQRHMGDWGGIIILGKSKTNHKGGIGTMEGFLDPKLAVYGGTNTEDDSGVLKYVRIEFPGAKFNNKNELNGITLCGVGSGTIMENIQVTFSNDDSFEFFGGTVNAKYLLSYKCVDDDFDVSNGYNGKLQFGVAVKDPLLTEKDITASRAIEADSYANDDPNANQDSKPLTSCEFSNFTLISVDKANTGGKQLEQAVCQSNNASISLYNSTIVGYRYAIFIKGYDTERNLMDGDIELENNIFIGCSNPIGSSSTNNKDFNSWFVINSQSNKFIKSYQPTDLVDPFNQQFPVFTALKTSQLSSGANFEGLIVADSLRKGTFFERVNYIGAFGTTDWTSKWSNFTPKSTPYPVGNTPVSGTLSGVINWTKSKVYILKGVVTVATGSKLNIEPGTVILGESASKGTLVISSNASINADGTPTQPIIFTSDKPIDKRKEGDWGGIILVGKAKVNGTSYMSSFDNLPSPIKYGWDGKAEHSGTLRYVRVEFAGAKLQNIPLSGITMLGLASIDMAYVQVSYALGNSFEWSGGKANAKHIISYATNDDDFSINIGYSGFVQYALALRDPQLAELGKANGFESVSHPNESVNYVNTKALFSNITIVGPKANKTSQFNQNFNCAAFLSKNSAISLYNSVFMGFPKGLQLDGPKVEFNAQSNLLNFRNNVIAGCDRTLVTSSGSEFNINQWFIDGKNRNVPNTADVKLTAPYNYSKPSFVPLPDSPLLKIPSELVTAK